jgi:hypothetical protein
MGILIIDGNSVFEIDEDCYKRNKITKNCDIDKYMKPENMKSINKKEQEYTRDSN